MTNNFYFLYVRGMQRPGFLYADTVGILSNSEGFSVASTLFLQYGSLEYLNSLAVTLFDLCVYFYSISYAKARYFCFQLSSFDVFNNLVHLFSPFVPGCS